MAHRGLSILFFVVLTTSAVGRAAGAKGAGDKQKTSSPPPAAAPAASATPTPVLRIQERFWIKPGPVQSGAGAPKLLIMYPPEKAEPLEFGEAKTRYAGRVEPPDAKVTVNGAELKVWPGGVFTGLLEPVVGETLYTFSAEAGGKNTDVARSVVRQADTLPGPPAWPLAFHPTAPVSPGGAREYWLRPGSILPVRLRASPGHKAEVRFGSAGPWIAMAQKGANPDDGGVYEAEIKIDGAVPDTPTPGRFRLTGRPSPEAADQSIEMDSKFKLRRVPADQPLVGRVSKNLATFLKNRDGWDRFGNWWRDTTFPIAERLGDRASVDFGPTGGDFAKGFLETENVDWCVPAPPAFAAPRLDAPRVSVRKWGPFEELALEWTQPAPLASIFELSVEGTGLTVLLPGVADVAGIGEAAPGATKPGAGRISARMAEAEGARPARAEFAFAGGAALWGYGWRTDPGGTVRLFARVISRPTAPAKNTLRGIKIMLDAGHGGEDEGALGPSGLAEADLNLVLSNHLERELRARGAEVRQLRAADVTLPLDDRVDRAWEYDPDLFVSLHHNSVAMSADPMSDAGPKVYYHYPQSIGLASAVAARLAPVWGPQAQARIFPEVFRVNRNVTAAPSILVEAGFVCNPVDEIQLRRTEFLEKMAAGIAEGLADALGPVKP